MSQPRLARWHHCRVLLPTAAGQQHNDSWRCRHRPIRMSRYRQCGCRPRGKQPFQRRRRRQSGCPTVGFSVARVASTTRVILLSRQCCQWRCRRHQGSDESTPWTASSTTAIEFRQCRQVGVSTPQRRVGVEFRDSVAGGTIDDDRQPRVGDTVDSGVDDDRPDPRCCWVAAPTATAPHQLTSRHRLTNRHLGGWPGSDAPEFGSSTTGPVSELTMWCPIPD